MRSVVGNTRFWLVILVVLASGGLGWSLARMGVAARARADAVDRAGLKSPALRTSAVWTARPNTAGAPQTVAHTDETGRING